MADDRVVFKVHERLQIEAQEDARDRTITGLQNRRLLRRKLPREASWIIDDDGIDPDPQE